MSDPSRPSLPPLLPPLPLPPLEDDPLVRRLFTAARREPADAGAELRVARAAEDAVNVVVAGRGMAAVSPSSVDAPVVSLSTEAPHLDETPPRRKLRRLRTALAVLSAAAALALVGSGFLIKKQSEESAAQTTAAEAQRAVLQQQIDSAKAESDKQGAAVLQATAALATAQDGIAKARAQHDLDLAMQKQTAASAAVRSAAKGAPPPGSPGKSGTPAAACTCDKMDPLCGCVP